MPARSRVTIRRTRTEAGLQRTFEGDRESEREGSSGFGSVVASALRESREALLDIQGQLDALLAALRQTGAAPDAAAPERLRTATRQAGAALAALGASAGLR